MRDFLKLQAGYSITEKGLDTLFKLVTKRLLRAPDVTWKADPGGYKAGFEEGLYRAYHTLLIDASHMESHNVSPETKAVVRALRLRAEKIRVLKMIGRVY
jgi:hypothetical protein